MELQYMRKHQFLHSGLSFLILLTMMAAAQTREELYQRYESGDMQVLHTLMDQGVPYPGWQTFLEALFEPEAGKAVKLMASAYSRSDDARLHLLIRKRVACYYSAQGYYETARRIEEDSDFFLRLASINQDVPAENSPASGDGEAEAVASGENGSRYGVQVGAYQTKENALKERRKYLQSFPQTQVVSKVSNGQTLFVVVVGNCDARSQAESLAEEVQRKYKLKGYIIQY